jgi:hypothetical protein
MNTRAQQRSCECYLSLLGSGQRTKRQSEATTKPSAAAVTSHASPRQHFATEYMHATVRDQRCYEIAHTVLVAGMFSGFISGTKMSTQSVCNEQFYESVFGSSSSQRRLIIQVHLCTLYDCNKYYRTNRQVVVFAYISGDIPHLNYMNSNGNLVLDIRELVISGHFLVPIIHL